MNDSRFGCAAIAHQGKIYVSGGFGKDKNILNTSEMFDPETGKWTRLSPMKGMSGFVGGVLVDRPVHLEESVV
jgi:N-acetylneuraminic acid mutarotase